jgi:rhamnosyltransferase
MNNVAGIVVLYNPDSVVFDNINTYSSQVDTLFIYDNSEIINENSLKISQIPQIKYISYKDNKGIAFGLNCCIKNALREGVDYALTMDQDSKATPGMVVKLFEIMEMDKDIVIASPVHTNKFNTQISYEGRYTGLMYAKTSGNLVDLKKFKILGNFKNDYFIDYVDIEYGLRINKNNLKIVQVNDAILIHSEADLTRKRILWFYVYPMNNAPVRIYYKMRNLLYLKDEYKAIYPDFIKNEISYFVKLVVKFLFFEHNKVPKLKMLIRGYMDYRRGIKGKLK